MLKGTLKMDGFYELSFEKIIPYTAIWDQLSRHILFETNIPEKDETTAMRDQPLMRDHCCSSKALHFYTSVPVMKDHLSHKTTFSGPMGWSKV